MTKQQAINVMEKYTYTDIGLSRVVIEAHKMARAALQREKEWVLASKRCPKEPEAGLDIEDMQEYIVMILGAVRPTTLIYTGAGEWFDGVTQDYYPVVAWQSMPKPFFRKPKMINLKKEKQNERERK